MHDAFTYFAFETQETSSELDVDIDTGTTQLFPLARCARDTPAPVRATTSVPSLGGTTKRRRSEPFDPVAVGGHAACVKEPLCRRGERVHVE